MPTTVIPAITIYMQDMQLFTRISALALMLAIFIILKHTTQFTMMCTQRRSYSCPVHMNDKRGSMRSQPHQLTIVGFDLARSGVSIAVISANWDPVHPASLQRVHQANVLKTTTNGARVPINGAGEARIHQ